MAAPSSSKFNEMSRKSNAFSEFKPVAKNVKCPIFSVGSIAEKLGGSYGYAKLVP